MDANTISVPVGRIDEGNVKAYRARNATVYHDTNTPNEWRLFIPASLTGLALSATDHAALLQWLHANRMCDGVTLTLSVTP